MNGPNSDAPQGEDQPTMETKLEQIAVKAVNQLPKSVVREIHTPRSVGEPGAGDCLRRGYSVPTRFKKASTVGSPQYPAAIAAGIRRGQEPAGIIAERGIAKGRKK
jgi:hypothetical protein